MSPANRICTELRIDARRARYLLPPGDICVDDDCGSLVPRFMHRRLSAQLTRAYRAAALLASIGHSPRIR